MLIPSRLRDQVTLGALLGLCAQVVHLGVSELPWGSLAGELGRSAHGIAERWKFDASAAFRQAKSQHTEPSKARPEPTRLASLHESAAQTWWGIRTAFAAELPTLKVDVPRTAGGWRTNTARPALTPQPAFDGGHLGYLFNSEGPREAETFLTKLQVPVTLPVPANDAVRKYLDYYGNDATGRAAFSVWLKRSGRYEKMIEASLRKYRLPRELISIVFIESGFVPTALSPAGAAGLWQFMPATARNYGLTVEENYDERLDSRVASEAAAHHLADLYDQLNDWALVLAAYNCGSATVKSLLQSAGSSSFWDLVQRTPAVPDETVNYVPSVLAVALLLANREHFQFEGVEPEAPGAHTTRVEVTEALPVAALAYAAGTSVEALLELNPQLKDGSVTDTGARVAVNIASEWFGRWRTVLPRVAEPEVAALYAQVPASFDWGRDDLSNTRVIKQQRRVGRAPAELE